MCAGQGPEATLGSLGFIFYTRGQQVFFVKDQLVSSFGFMGPTVSVSVSHCC